jgi:hypothetical protein
VTAVNYEFTDDYKTEFKAHIDALWATSGLGVGAKNNAIQRLTDAYMAHTGERPDVTQLDRLSTWLLRGVEHEDADADVKTHRQLRHVRTERETTSYNDELSVNNDGNRRTEPAPIVDGPNAGHYDFVRTDYDHTDDKRKYNAIVRKT